MLLEWWRRRRARRELDPLATYDRLIESVEAEAAAVRRAAATLLALQGEQRRGMERARAQAEQLLARAQETERQGDLEAASQLRVDARQVRKAPEAAALQRVEEDAALLVSRARELQERLGALRAEREDAALRLRAGAAVREALQQESERFEQRIALEAARDEVERAHALAELYREEGRGA